MISAEVSNLPCSYKVSFLIANVSVASALCIVKFSIRKILKSTREENNRNYYLKIYFHWKYTCSNLYENECFSIAMSLKCLFY